jgi:hypothetical protein
MLLSMAAPVGPVPDGDPSPPPADPVAIRACLTPAVAAEFDAEWNVVLEEAKVSHSLAGIHQLLSRWRITAHAELRDPGTYFRVLAAAARAQASGQAPAGSVSGEEITELINRRLGR